MRVFRAQKETLPEGASAQRCYRRGGTTMLARRHASYQEVGLVSPSVVSRGISPQTYPHGSLRWGPCRG